MINLARVKRGMYFDSITLMGVARSLGQLTGVAETAALMATPSNLQLLADAGLLPFESAAGTYQGTDTLIVVRADTKAHAEAALDVAEAQLLSERRTEHPPGRETSQMRQARSLEEAARLQPQARVALISVPGSYAAIEAQQALRADLHVFLFSDHVSLADEVSLKRLGSERGLLVMGPDCGTARLNGVGLGFVNVVPDGPVGIVGASGTGMQQVMCLLAHNGHGISQAIGCGGRDLSAAVGGITTLQGLRMLQEDEATQVIVLISKPPAPAVAETVLHAAGESEKPVVVIFPGSDPAGWQNRSATNISFARTLAEAARLASTLCTHNAASPAPQATTQPQVPLATVAPSAGLTDHPGQPLYLAALFSGGTLCSEALHLWGTQSGPIYSNIALNPAWRWHRNAIRQGHYALDLGADEYTHGRPHPMIDPEARLTYLRQATSDAGTRVILLDVILGYCAHPDPAAIYAPLIEQGLQQAARNRRQLSYIISLCGTEADPQQLSRQLARLRLAGAEVYTSNAEAALRCLELLPDQGAG
ncbi:MAG TPA: acyl-CoA synthetase FdrA [Ktedonobacteraceae bacterium]|jgi:FdrA protein